MFSLLSCLSPSSHAATYVEWRDQAFSTTSISEALRTEGADPDADGLKNYLEFLMGGNPAIADFNAPLGFSLDNNRIGGLFNISKSAEKAAWAVEISSSLSDWSRSSVSLMKDSETSLANQYSFLANRVPGNAFVRMMVEDDTDGDGIGDSFETIAHGLDPLDPSDAASDEDEDGLTALQEYKRGSNPMVADVVVTITPVVDTAVRKEAIDARFTFTATGHASTLNIPFELIGDDGGIVGTSDFEFLRPNGTPMTGAVPLSVNFPAITLVLRPKPNAKDEVPKNFRFRVLPTAGYLVNDLSEIRGKIIQASDIPANERLFVAPLSPALNVASGASGVATLILNGSNTIGSVTLSYNGLTSGQTVSYIHHANPTSPANGSGPQVAGFPLGNFVDLPWTIRPSGTYSSQALLDALFRLGGLNLYMNVSSGTFPDGEIRGAFQRQTGSSTLIVPPDPEPVVALAGEPLRNEVARFLTQATFGPTTTDIEALYDNIVNNHAGDRIAGFEAWIDAQLAMERTSLYELLAAYTRWKNPGSDSNTPFLHSRSFYWQISLFANDQLHQRLAAALSEFFVISKLPLTLNRQYLAMGHYWDQMGFFGTGNFRTSLEWVSKSPLMGEYLSSIRNQKEIVVEGNVVSSPDENYAREIMQLFSIGLIERHLDGSLKLNSSGRIIQTYDNVDITELARVFTGWNHSVRSVGGQTSEPNNNFNLAQQNKYYDNSNYIEPMKNFGAQYHDTGAKTLFRNSTIPIAERTIAAGLDGEQDLDRAHDIIFNHPNVAPFVSRFMIQRLTSSNPSRGYIYRVAQKFEDNGSGVRGDMLAVLKAVLLDPEARDLAVTTSLTDLSTGKAKEPIIAFIHACRVLGMTKAAGNNQRNLNFLKNNWGYPESQRLNFTEQTFMDYDRMDQLFRTAFDATDDELRPRFAQRFHESPTVFNFFLPDFSPGGILGNAGLVAPELQIATEQEVTGSHLSYWELVAQSDSAWQINMDAQRSAFASDLTATGGNVRNAVTRMIDRYDDTLNSGGLKRLYDLPDAPVPNMRKTIIDAVVNQTGPNDASDLQGKVATAIYLMLTNPEYGIQR